MQSVLFLAALALGAAAEDLTVDTPTVGGVAGAAECQPLLLLWSGGTPPYIITVDTVPAGATHVAEFDGLTSTQVAWPAVNATQNTQLLLTIKDSNGLTKTSAAFPVVAGSGDGCLAGSGGSDSTSSSAAPHSNTLTSTGPSSPITSVPTAGQSKFPVSGGASTTNAGTSSSSRASIPSSAFGGASTSSGSSTGTSSSSAGASIPPTRSFQSMSPTSSASSVNTSSPAVQSGRQNNLAGPIAGGIIGGLVLVLGVLAFFFCRGRGQRGPLPTTPAHLSILPFGETQSSSLPSQMVPSRMLANERKVRRRPIPQNVPHDIPAVTESHAPVEATLMGPASQPESPNAELLDEIRMLRHQMHAIEQRIQPQNQPTIPVMDQAHAEEPPEYTS